jgi:exosortase
VLIGLAGLGLTLAWAYWPVLAAMADKWQTEEQYSHGYLVPAFALLLLWFRRDRLADGPAEPCWWGLAFLGAGALLLLAGGRYYYDWFEAISLLPCLAGFCLLLGGWRALAWAWPAVGFLGFMMPLPHRVETALSQPLRRFATQASTYALQTLGFPALAEGNVIVLNDVRIGVVEACNGLSMLLVFIALAAGVVLVIRRAWWEKVCLLASAIPIALAANVVRLTVTGVLHDLVGNEAGNAFHDWGGWVMMPLALGLLWLELWLLARLFIPVAAPRPVALDLAKPPAASRAPQRRKPKRAAKR